MNAQRVSCGECGHDFVTKATGAQSFRCPHCGTVLVFTRHKRNDEVAVRTAGGLVGGAILGASFGGPVGAVIGGLVGGILVAATSANDGDA